MCQSSEKNDICFFVMIPVYKTEQYVRECIESVLNQKDVNFQIVLVDDGTPDAAGDICDAYAACDERITVIHKENGGLISARRAAIALVKQKASSGDFAMFLDSDDYLKPDAISTINRAIKNGDNIDIVLYGMDRVHNGQVYRAFDASQSYVGEITNKRDLYKVVFCNDAYNPLCRKAVRVEILDGDDYSRFYQIQRAEDLLQSINLYKAARKVLFIPDSIYNYRVNPNSITRSIKYENYKIDPTVRRMVWDFIVEQDVFNESDFAEYLVYAKELLLDEISLILQLDTEKKNIFDLLDKMRADEYYSMIFKTVTPKDKKLFAIKNGKYTGSYVKARIRKILSRILRFVRGLK